MFLTVLDVIALITNKVMICILVHRNEDIMTSSQKNSKELYLTFLSQTSLNSLFNHLVLWCWLMETRGMLLLCKACLHSLPRELNPSRMLITKLHDQKFHPKVELNRVHCWVSHQL